MNQLSYKYDISIIIACYNEEELLEDNILTICNTMNQTKYSYEIIFVDDYSIDSTRDIILSFCNQNNNMSYIFHNENCGRGKTVCDGFLISKGKYIGFIDVDLEIHSRYIPSMIAVLQNGYDVALAYRVYKIDLTFRCFVRHIISFGYRKLLKLVTNIKTRDTETGYKFFSSEKVLPLIKESRFNGWFWDTEIMYLCEKSNFKIKEIECLFLRNNTKTSKLRVIPDTIEYVINLVEFKKNYKNYVKKVK